MSSQTVGTALGDLRTWERSVFSDWGEDGAIDRLFDVIGTTSRYFVEFGAKDGFEKSNTANLRVHEGWHGLLMDAAAQPDHPLVKHEFITAENVNDVFARHGVPHSFDLLSLDIDGNDYWVWKALTYRPRIVVIEYNIFFALDVSKTITYDPKHVWDKSSYHGASLAALRKLGDTKGYELVHTDSWAPNAFFVLRSELPADFQEVPIEQVTPWNHNTAPPDTADRPWVTV